MTESSLLRPLTEQEARALAHGLASQLLGVFTGWISAFPEDRISLADLLRLGVAFHAMVNDAFRDLPTKEFNRTLHTKVFESLHTPGALEEFLYKLLLERGRGESNDIQKSIDEVQNGAITPQKMRAAVLQSLPKAPRGRPKKCVNPEQQKAFLAGAKSVTGACAQFLEQKALVRGKSSREIVEYLHSENPKAFSLLSSQLDFLEEAINSKVHKRRKELGTQARNLAFGICGRAMFAWDFSYSIQQAGIFQRKAREVTRK